ncbi:hypothetical protein BE1S18E01_01630 [Acinetobacter sp. BEC1-S18-ESBL-01]|jgi:hypothetical protein|uniref:Uncharacterized protein n=1 Tax=Acinetobacter pittii TaxID=48296 RepID=A0A1C2V5Y6_ACIPI|nr:MULTISPECIES: hypothetical protein [Acinetobacter]AMO39388.1 hypothetical protein A0J50_00725 [Acinetobacter sp. DUT-2]OIG13611.1 hypothetical protein A7N09_19390 [Acinetobacter baumannii]AVN20565.1 hypothetical protein C6N17_01480 [Acinetobacter pittii]AVZ06784.1 hypothetical protein DBQ26_20610 [Acinetobacter pittii]ENW13149.1 hypothetical protein F930_00706 [Acinetobacter pittii ANC 3678]
MVGFLKIMVPILLIVFLLMGLWVSVLHFPWEWMTYVTMGLEVFVAMLILPFEFQSQHVTGINHFGFINLSICLALLLGLGRLLVWAWIKFFA